MATQQMTAQERLDHMKQAINEGGGALYQGRTILRVDDLPTLSDLATTEVEKGQALADVAARRQALNDEEARLRAGLPLGSGDNVTTTGPGTGPNAPLTEAQLGAGGEGGGGGKEGGKTEGAKGGGKAGKE